MGKIRLRDGSIVDWPEGRPLPDGASVSFALSMRDGHPGSIADAGSQPLATMDSFDRSKTLHLVAKMMAATDAFAREDMARNLSRLAAMPRVNQRDRDYIAGLVKGTRALHARR